MSKTPLIMAVSFLVLATTLILLSRRDQDTSFAPGANSGDGGSESKVMIYCAASNRAVMESIRERYQEETGRIVQVQYGASQSLLAQLTVSGRGDLYLPADTSYIAMCEKDDLTDEVLPIAAMQCGLVVRKGNPLKINSLDDLLRPEVRLVQANPDAAAVGAMARDLLGKIDRWDDVHEATKSYRSTVTDVANDLLIDAADVGIVFDAVLHTYPDLEFVPIPELAAGRSEISVAVLRSATNSVHALHFARYIAARDRGQEQYQKFGFQVHSGDAWHDQPSISLFAGSMLRPAIEETIEQFQIREGVQVNCVYNGCGILVAQMEAGQVPDAYFACDAEFMDQVSDRFPDPTVVSENELVILVQKGNPHEIASLRDLTEPGLRVGIGHEKQCAMGWLTQTTFREGGIQKEVMANVTVQSPTGDMLVNQMRAGALDAAVVYMSNAAGSADLLDAVQITGLPCSIATQP